MAKQPNKADLGVVGQPGNRRGKLWKPGQTGNPRKIGSGRKTNEARKLAREAFSPETMGQLAAERLTVLIKENNLGAIIEALNRCYGKVALKLDVTGISLDLDQMIDGAEAGLADKAAREREAAAKYHASNGEAKMLNGNGHHRH